MQESLSRQVTAASVTASFAGTVLLFPEATDVVKAVVQALHVIGCAYIIRGKELHLEWAEVRGYRVMMVVYMNFLILSCLTLLRELWPVF
jgi:hypothetical protein